MKTKVTETKIDTLIPDDINANKGTEYGKHLMEKSFRELGAGRSILLDKHGRIIAGNKSVEQCAEIGLDDIIVVETDGTKLVAVKRMDIDLDTKKGRELALSDNATSKANLAWDEENLAVIKENWGVDTEQWGIDLSDFGYNDESKDADEGNPYTNKIKAPKYEIKGEKPEEKELYDIEKTKQLINEIDAAPIDREVKDFLKLAAGRHTVFNYEKIAEYYAHAPKEIQELMENSALVIIDFNKALEKGYVVLSQEIANQYSEDHGDEE